MARQGGVTLENKFLRGLVTMNQALSFPADACTETYNCVFDQTGLITRRLGVDLEENYGLTNSTQQSGEAFSEFLWTNVEANNLTAFLVQQQAEMVYFFDVTTNTTPSANIATFSIDLSLYCDVLFLAALKKEACQFDQGRGALFIVNRYCPALAVSYDADLVDISVNAITLQQRDFEGVDDGLVLDGRPTTSVGALKLTNPEHFYNLLNQGWGRVDGSGTGPADGAKSGNGNTVMDSWDVGATTLPSNADIVGYFKLSTSDTFNAGLIYEHQAGNTPAAKGHFILTVGENDRNAAMVAESFTGATLPASLSGDTTTLVDITGQTRISDGGWATLSNAFDGLSATSTTQTTSTDVYLGTAAGSSITLRYTAFTLSADQDVTIILYGKNGVPASISDGTALVSTTYTGGSGTQNYNLTYTGSTAYTHYWVGLGVGGLSTALSVKEFALYITTTATYENNPSTLAFMSGRLFYAGFTNPSIGSNIYFSQVLESSAQYGYCYQSNDPTSDEIADLLATDGGVIKVPDLGQVQRIFAFRNQLLIIANNGVWIVKGSGGAFAATSYEVSKVSGIGSTSPMSIVDVKGLPIWWAEDGIYSVEYDARYDSVALRSLTEETIKNFILDIPVYNRQYVKGAFDRRGNTVYWLYNDDESLATTDVWTYNKALLFNALTSAFYLWSFTTSTTQPQAISGIVYITSSDRIDPPAIKFTTVFADKLTYSQAWQTDYTDWTDYATNSGNAADEQDYTSYLISGFRIDGQAVKFFQGNYIYTYLRRETDASAWVQGLYQFTDDGDSGKWSTPQQVYNSLTTYGRSHHAVKVSRRKIRGKGQALQLKIYSETGKPFSIIGWGLVETTNAQV